MTDGQTAAVILLIAVAAVASVTSIALYWADKRAARRGGRRVPERGLHVLGLLGGWPGGWLAQRWFRHKRRKRRFMGVFVLTVLGHVGLVAGLLYWLER
jgi:uncharacterized membrane protein YsdA (DUF1294 family)